MLLIAETGEDATSHSDLETKLAQLYFGSTSKIDLEKKLAAIHPHRDFILKYADKPVKSDTAEKFPAGSIPLAPQYLKPIDHGEIVIQQDLSKPSEGKACACGCQKKQGFMNADGGNTAPQINVTAIAITTMISAVAIFGIAMYFKHKR